LHGCTRYTAHITTDVSDVDEGSLASAVAWTFTTSPEPALAHAAYAFSEGTGGTAADSSANGNTATLTRPGLWTAAGRYGNGLLLRRADGARVPASGSLDAESSLTLETWVYPTSYRGLSEVDLARRARWFAVQLGMMWGDGSIGFGITTTAGRFSVYAYRSILPETWTHIAATYDGSMLRLYVNGQLADGSAGTGSIVASTRDLCWDERRGEKDSPGTLDDVRIYSRALTRARDRRRHGNARVGGDAAGGVVHPSIERPDNRSIRRRISPRRSTGARRGNSNGVGVRASRWQQCARSPRQSAISRSHGLSFLDPTARLADVAIYTATLKTTITNSAGVALQNEYSWTFTTRDGTPRPSRG
jgi:hypothetical protein